MKAVGLYQHLPIGDPDSLQDLDIDMPVCGDRDLLVQIKAVSVNPVDTKVRAQKGIKVDRISENARILGWDAAGIVHEVGAKVTGFKTGDHVYYSGTIDRPGTNSEYHLVDERIAGHKPTSQNFAESAALPLTGITAWEALFDRLAIDSSGKNRGQKLLIIGGAGGVGSIATQLAKKLAGLTVISTASRSETVSWCLGQGADHVVNHHTNIVEQLANIGMDTVEYIFCCNDTTSHWDTMTKLIAPQGAICSIVETTRPVELGQLKSKSATFVWEFMFTRAMFGTSDMARQRDILNDIARLVDDGELSSTLTDNLGTINATNLKRAHAKLESGKAIGKMVLEGFRE